MGGRLGRNRASSDPFYNPVPPPSVYQAGYDPTGGLQSYNVSPEYEYEYVPTRTIGNLYGTPIAPRSNQYGGRYVQGLNQMPGVLPWNYGNYYLGNTTMQMMPFMMNQFNQPGQLPALPENAKIRVIYMPNMTPCKPAVPCCMPQPCSMPAMPCCMPQPCSMPAMPRAPCCMSQPYGAAMMASATPLPVAFNPLVQGMYPMASASPANWMTPSSFMSALASGPMPYRPPAIEFPSNVGMVMTVPYGTPNPLLLSPGFKGVAPSFGYGARSPAFSSYYSPMSALPPVIPPAARPLGLPQPFPASYPAAPLGCPFAQSLPAVRFDSTVAPSASASTSLPVPALTHSNPLQTSHGALCNSAISQPHVLGSHYAPSRLTSQPNESTRGSLPVYNPADQSNSLIGEPITSSLPALAPLSGNVAPEVTVSKAKYQHEHVEASESSSGRRRRLIPSRQRYSFTSYHQSILERRSEPVLPPITHGQLISDSGWLPKDVELPHVTSVLTKKKKKKSKKKRKTKRRTRRTAEYYEPTTHANGARVSFVARDYRRGHSTSSASEYDCAICHEQRERRRLEEYYGLSTASSLYSAAKEPHDEHMSSTESAASAPLYSPHPTKDDNRKKHRRPKKSKKSKDSSIFSNRSASPVLLRKTTLPEPRKNLTIHEVDEEEEEEERIDEVEPKPQPPPAPKPSEEHDSTADKSDAQTSRMTPESRDD